MLSDIADLPSIKLTDNDWLRFELDPLTPFGREIASKELRETPEIKEKAIEDLKNLLQGNSLAKHSKSKETLIPNSFFVCIFHKQMKKIYIFRSIMTTGSYDSCVHANIIQRVLELW